MKHVYIVQMPMAEARHLAGIGPRRPPTPEQRALAAAREWVAGLSRRRAPTVPVRKVVEDLTAVLASAPQPQHPVRGPFAPPPSGGPPPPGHIEYLGAGIVRLDEAAISTLATLADSDDFRVHYTDVGPILTVGTDHYLASQEEPGLKVPGPLPP